jgi:hypothetical protein
MRARLALDRALCAVLEVQLTERLGRVLIMVATPKTNIGSGGSPAAATSTT